MLAAPGFGRYITAAMPTYDYECANCRHTLEIFQSMMDDPLTDCPSCGAPQLRRVISGGTGIIFKGSGFYVNDSRGSSKASGSASATDTDSAKTTGGDSKTGDAKSGGESKPAAAAATPAQTSTPSKSAAAKTS